MASGSWAWACSCGMGACGIGSWACGCGIGALASESGRLRHDGGIHGPGDRRRMSRRSAEAQVRVTRSQCEPAPAAPRTAHRNVPGAAGGVSSTASVRASHVRLRHAGDHRAVADPPPGEMAEADFGVLGHWPDPSTGRRRRVYGLLVSAGRSAGETRLLTGRSRVASHSGVTRCGGLRRCWELRLRRQLRCAGVGATARPCAQRSSAPRRSGSPRRRRATWRR